MADEQNSRALFIFPPGTSQEEIDTFKRRVAAGEFKDQIEAQLGRPSPTEQIGAAYRNYVADPLTQGLGGSIGGGFEAAVGGARALNQAAPSWFPGMPATRDVVASGENVARYVVPQSVSEALAMGATAGVAPFTGPRFRGAVARTAAGAGGGALGAALEGSDPLKGALAGGAGAFSGETAGSVVPWGLRNTIGRPLISNARTRNMQGLVEGAVPEYAAATQAVRETLPNLGQIPLSSRRAAVMSHLAESKEGKAALGQHLEAGIRRAESIQMQATKSTTPPLLTGPSLQQAYEAMPALSRELLVGPTVPIMQTIPAQYGPTGLLVKPAQTVKAGDRFTLRQSQDILSYTGSKAFKEAPAMQGTDDVAQMMFWSNVRDEVKGQLAPDAAREFFRARNAYGVGEVVHDAIRAGAFEGEPNRLLMAHRTLEDHLARNRGEYIRRMGEENYMKLWDAVAPGAALGTASRVAPGAGTPMSRMESLERSPGGSITRVPMAALNIILPNLGTKYTGRAPFRPWGPTGQAVKLDWPAIQTVYGISGFGQD